MTSPLTMAVYRPAGRLGLYVRAFQVFAATRSAGASVLDFGGGDMSVPVCFGDLRFHEPPHQAAPVIAAAVSPRLGTRAGAAPPRWDTRATANPARPGSTTRSIHRQPTSPRQGKTRMPSQDESPALKVARAYVEAWGKKDWDTAHSLLAPGVHVTATRTGPYPPPTDLTGA